MLESSQLADLDQAERDLKDKKLILDTAIDVQAILRFMVDQGVITKDEVNKYREEVKKSPKWSAAIQYIDQTMTEIERYRRDPQSQLKRMFEEKMKGKF